MSKPDALALAQVFAASSSEPGDWPGISRGTLAAELTARINSPDLIAQRDTSLCGPASFVRAVAVDMPLTYARCAIDLYRTGEGNIVGLNISPGRRMKRSPPKMGTGAADWIMLASVRDEENVLLSGAATPGLLSGMTLPRAMVKWFKSAGYKSVSDQTRLAWWPLETRLATARHASNLCSGGYKVVMLVDAGVFSDKKDRINVPNHWVTLSWQIFNSPAVKLDDTVFVSIYTWGQQRLLPVTLRLFLQKFYGFVAARL
ncbi:MAG TPA: hypothetical protein VJ890_18460 [Vineibacter sp.]|nr:hypothetical protein [Vineibacter sp.]